MKLKLLACLSTAGALVLVTAARAAPITTPFLAVDVNGANYGGGQTVGPTLAGYQPFNAFQGFDQLDPNYNPAEDWGNLGGPPNGLSKTFVTPQGNITANMIGVGLNLGARNRGANAGGIPDLQRDFAFAQRDGAVGFGRNYVKLVLAGLVPNQTYEFTGFAREPAFQDPTLADPNNAGQSFQSWSDLVMLGGADGPAAWMDANVGAGQSYQPAVGGVNNPIPKKGRSQVAGPDSLSASDPYFHSLTFLTTADASGKVTVYTWSDPNGFGSTVQGASLLNGFQLGIVPEPASIGLCALGLAGLMSTYRRRARVS
jgi:hypothetical protein